MFRTKFEALKKQWNGVETEFGGCLKASLGIEIVKSLQNYGSKDAQICANTGTTKTFNDLHALTIRAAINLRDFGCKNGDVILFMTENSGDIAPIVFAALYLGVQITAFPVFSSKTEYEYFLHLTKPNFIVCDLERYHISKQCLSHTKICAMIFTFEGQIDVSIPVNDLFEKQDADLKIEPADIDPITHTAYILETSGTTGKRKVRISHAMILDKIHRLSGVFGQTDIILGFTLLDGVSSFRSLLVPTLNGSTRIVNHYPFSPKRYCEIVEKFKVTVSIISATKVRDILDYEDLEFADLSSLKYFCAGGTKITYRVIQILSKHFVTGKFCQNYGMTETAGTIATNLSHMENDCVGQLIGGCKAKIVNESGERLGIGEVGEICLKFPYPILGYLGDDQYIDFDDEGFFMTGDIARFDENNDLFIVDRKKEMFKSFGYPVTPTEIEDYLNLIEGVKQSCVVPIPNQRVDNLPASVIVKTRTSKCTEQSICDSVAKQFSYYKHLRGGVYFVDELPLNAREKVDRNSVKQMAVAFHNNLK